VGCGDVCWWGVMLWPAVGKCFDGVLRYVGRGVVLWPAVGECCDGVVCWVGFGVVAGCRQLVR
jgi:hypothetical protein